MLYFIRTGVRKPAWFYLCQNGGILPAKGYKSGEFVLCQICGKEFYKTQIRLKRSNGKHYCSRKCQDIARHINAFESRTCEMCGSDFQVAKRSSQRFCSNECQHEWQKTRIGELNPRYERIKCSCDWCNADLYITNYTASTRKHHFCNTECRQAWYTNVYAISSENREKSRKSAIKQFENQPSLTMDSTPQKIVNKILQSLGIKYTREEPIGYYLIDNYLEDYNLMIEVMGDFWHANPLKYCLIKYHRQVDAIRRDKAKHTYVKERCGVEILYLWEDDILNRQDLCESLIQQYVLQAGALDNYQSLNYSFSNGLLQTNDNIIRTYQEMDHDDLPVAISA